MSKVKLFLLAALVCFSQTFAQTGRFVFTPDKGTRVDSASMAGIFVSDSGKVFLYVHKKTSTELYIAKDGLNFKHVDITKFPNLRTLRIANGDYIQFEVNYNSTTGKAILQRSVSHDGFTFKKESDTLFTFPANDNITSSNVYYTAFKDSAGGIMFVYLAGSIDNARSIYSPKNAPGMVFGGYHSNIFNDSTLGGRNKSYWDPNGILLPNGNLKVITMNQHGVAPSSAMRTGTIYTFTSTDNGRSWVKDPDSCIRYDDFTEFEVHSLNDPKLARFPDGTFRIYMASLIKDSTTGDLYNAIISASSNGITDVKEEQASKIKDFRLFNNYPNPFNPSTTIEYSIPLPENKNISSVPVTLKIYDMLGREIKTLVNKQEKPGNYSVQFNADNLPSGIYFYRLQAGGFAQTKKMILLK